MPAFVKTPEDEKIWTRAKERAKKQGHEEDWAYVTGIYKKMKGGKVAAYDPEFLKRVENIPFRHPETGNHVKFVSLPTEEQKRWYAKWKAAKAQQAKPKPKKPKRPSFAKAREGAFGALQEDGWSLKPGLKVPKAEKDIDGDRVILHFKPQAVWMEVKGKAPPRSLHTDIRDVDPKQWASTLKDEARKMVDLEERFKMAREAFMGVLPGLLPGQSSDDPPPEPPPPAEVKKMLSNRMRGLARQLTVAGMRPPRQQMVEIGRALDTLLDQLDLLADQPGRQSLRRRILMTLRQRIAGSM